MMKQNWRRIVYIVQWVVPLRHHKTSCAPSCFLLPIRHYRHHNSRNFLFHTYFLACSYRRQFYTRKFPDPTTRMCTKSDNKLMTNEACTFTGLRLLYNKTMYALPSLGDDCFGCLPNVYRFARSGQPLQPSLAPEHPVVQSEIQGTRQNGNLRLNTKCSRPSTRAHKLSLTQQI